VTKRTRPTRPVLAAVAGVLLLAGCGTSGAGTEYGAEERSITVDKGEEFTLKVPANPALGQNWYLAEPKPEADVLEYRGKREETEGGGDLIGAGDGTQFFDFTALKPGRATIRLLHCPMAQCHSGTESAKPYPKASITPGGPSESPFPTATGTPTDRAAFFVYTVTVN
jgi:predicted secreted protein